VDGGEETGARSGWSRGGIPILLTVVALAVVLWGAYERHWSWTGFSDNDTLWDWLQLLLLPLAVAAVPVYLRRRPQGRRRTAHLGGLSVAAALVALGYLVPLAWTGFPGNTLWDWLELVVLPVAVVLAPLWIERGEPLPVRHRAAMAVGAAVFAVLVVVGYTAPWRWTGFTGNTLWDWLRLAIVPLLLPTILQPAVVAWLDRDDERVAAASGAGGPDPSRAGRPLVVPVALAATLAVGVTASQALGHGHGHGAGGGERPAAKRAAAPTGCRAAGARTLAADGAVAVRRTHGLVFACGASGRGVALGRGVTPGLVRLAGPVVAAVRQRCGPDRACSPLVEEARAGAARAVVHPLGPAGPVAGLALAPDGALAVAVRARCPSAAACGGDLRLLTGAGWRTVSSGPSFDPDSLAGHGSTIYWHFAGQASSTELAAAGP
jgi:hypothetical protein